MGGKDWTGDTRDGGVHRKEARSRALFANQHLVATVAQLREVGFTDSAISRRVAAGEWLRVHHGVIAPAIGTDSLQPFMAASLATRGILSHSAGLVVWGVGEGRPEITVEIGRRASANGVRVHRVREPGESVMVGRLRVHPIERVLCDAGYSVGPDCVQSAMERAIQGGLTTLDRLRMAARVNRNRPGVATLRHLLSRFSAGTRSVAEARVWRVLLRTGLPRPQRQFRVGPYLLDFAWPRHRICLEADGFAFHSSPAELERDSIRQNYLVLRDWLVLRYGWVGITERPDQLVCEVGAALESRTLRLGRRRTL